MIDFDYNATTPLKDSVREAMEPYLNGHYGNPSSVHQIGQKPKAAVEEARVAIAEELDTDPEFLTLTASGSEANTLAIRGLIRPPYDKRTIVTTPVEHSCVKDTVDWLEGNGATVHRAPVNEDGQVELNWFKKHVQAGVDLVTVMTVNNETGVIFPVDEIGELCRDHDVPMHTDAVQALGKIECSYRGTPVDLMTFSAHKIGGPKGSGVLVAPKSIELDPLIFGGHQERDRRGGTENVPAVVGFAEAIRQLDPDQFQETGRRRDQLETQIKQEIDGVYVVGEGTTRVGNTSGFLIKGTQGEDVVLRMDMEGIAVATGSACTSGSTQPSHVIEAMPIPGEYESDSFVRVSLPPVPELEQIETFVDELANCVETLRHESFV